MTQHKQAPASVKNREAPCSPSAAAKGVVTDHLTQTLDTYAAFEAQLELSPTTRKAERHLAFLRLKEAVRGAVSELHRLRTIALDGRVVKVVKS
jgi:hypothetical protein